MLLVPKIEDLFFFLQHKKLAKVNTLVYVLCTVDIYHKVQGGGDEKRLTI